MNDFEIAMIIADMKFLPGRITGRHPPFTEQIRIELTATYDVGFDDDGNEIPTKRLSANSASRADDRRDART
jgi:hypothetical protein